MDIITYLINKKILSKEQGEKIKVEAKKSKRTLEETILAKNIINEKSLFRLKSKLLNVPLKASLPENIPFDILSIIPKESVEFYKIIPLSYQEEEGIFEVGMIYPEDVQAQEALKFLARQQKLKTKIFLISFSNFKKILDKYQAPKREMEEALQVLEKEVGTKNTVAPEQVERLVEEAPIIKMVAVILRQAVEGKASDIHIEPSQDKLKIRYRLDGILYPSLMLPHKVHSAVVARIKILAGLRIDETRIPQDGRFSAKFGQKNIDFRISTFPTTLGEKVAIRVLDPEEGLKSLSELGFSKRNVALVNEAIKKPYGLILTTGPTGCGKTTTLYALLQILNKEAVNVVTLEDPVEYFINGVNQSQIKPEINYTFAQGLRQILRQDPDIIMVGEIRDGETANLAVHAALTGHLVLSTLHTTNAAGVIPRLLDMGIKPFLISPTLSLVVSQRLVRTLCPYCREKVEIKGKGKNYILDKIKNLPEKIKNSLNIKGKIYVYKAKGCKKCNFKGYSGREGIYEIFKTTDSLRAIINSNPTEKEIMDETKKSQEMTTMEQDGILKVLKGITSLEEVIRVIG